MAYGVNISWVAALACASAVAAAAPGCVTRPMAPEPLYDFDNVWLNEPIGGVAPWKRPDRVAIAAAYAARERRWARDEVKALEERLAAERRVAYPERARAAKPASARRKGSPSVGAASSKRPTRARPAARLGRTAASKPSPTAAAPRSVATQRRPGGGDPTSIGSGPTSGRTSLPTPGAPPRGLDPSTAAAERPILGDGTPSSELLAAAQRLVGLRDAFAGDALLRHLLAVAAIDVRVSAPLPRFGEVVWAALRARGLAFDQGPLAPGDLVFFHHASDLDGDGRASERFSAVAVVERITPSGVAVCIGEVGGVVGRLRLDPSRPSAYRDEAAGEVINTPLRPRALGPGPDLAGALFAGFARF